MLAFIICNSYEPTILEKLIEKYYDRINFGVLWLIIHNGRLTTDSMVMLVKKMLERCDLMKIYLS